MFVLATPMRRRGKALSQRDIQAAEPARGNLLVGQHNSELLNRHANIASFQVSGPNDPQPLPSLHDAVLSWMAPNGFVLSGVELVDGVAYAQSWWCRPVN
jgi:hypothetical protein